VLPLRSVLDAVTDLFWSGAGSLSRASAPKKKKPATKKKRSKR
jgi:hypothetical protein